jgi:hypothetical protein
MYVGPNKLRLCRTHSKGIEGSPSIKPLHLGLASPRVAFLPALQVTLPVSLAQSVRSPLMPSSCAQASGNVGA